MGTFDAFVVVDWSAASSPRLGRDSIWIGVARFGPSGGLVLDEPLNVPTRRKAEQQAARRMLAFIQEKNA